MKSKEFYTSIKLMYDFDGNSTQNNESIRNVDLHMRKNAIVQYVKNNNMIFRDGIIVGEAIGYIDNGEIVCKLNKKIDSKKYRIALSNIYTKIENTDLFDDSHYSLKCVNDMILVSTSK